MKITRLKITNFVQIADLDLQDLTGTTLLTGENGVGKTTALNALAFAFGFPVRDARGVQVTNRDLIGPNGDSCEVKLLLVVGDRNLKLTAGVSQKERSVEILDVDRKQPAFLSAKGITDTYAALYEAIGVPWSHIECALSPRAYLLGPDLGNLLADLVSGEWSMDDLRGAAGPHFAYIERWFGKGKPDLEAMGKTAFQTRTEVKKSLKALQADMATLEAMECPTSRDGKPMTESHIPTIEDALKGLQVQRDALIGEKARAEAGGESRRDELEKAKSDALVALELAAANRDKADKAYKASQETFQSATKALTGVKEAHAKASAEVEMAKQLHEQRVNSGNTCATCGHTMTEEEKIAGIEDAAHALHKAKVRLEEINLNDAKIQFDGFERANSEARDAMHRTMAEYDRLVAENNRLDFEIEKLGTAPRRSLDAIVTDIESTEERIAAGKQKLADLREYCRKAKLAAEIEAQTQEIERLDWAVAAFRDGEFLKGRLSGKINVFEDACNERLAVFGYSLSVKIEGKNAQVWLQKGDHIAAPIARCSKAELVLAGYAVATAFGTNSPICIDDMDAMFSETKSKFIAQLKARDNASPLFASGAWTAGSVDLEPINKYLTNAKVVWMGKE